MRVSSYERQATEPHQTGSSSAKLRCVGQSALARIRAWAVAVLIIMVAPFPSNTGGAAHGSSYH